MTGVSLAEMIGSRIKALYEVEANAFTDTKNTKLSGIDTGAKDDQTGAEIKALYEAEANAFTDALKTKLDAIEALAKDDQTGAEIKALYELIANAYTDTKNTKLNGIDTGADVTGSNPPQSHGNDKHTNRTRSVFVGSSLATTVANKGVYPTAAMINDGDVCYGTVRIPEDFVSNPVISAIIIPFATGNIIYDVSAQWALPGEGYNLNTDAHLDETIAGSVDNMLKSNMNIDFATPDAGVTPGAGDVIAWRYTQDTGETHYIVGFLLEYTGDQ